MTKTLTTHSQPSTGRRAFGLALIATSLLLAGCNDQLQQQRAQQQAQQMQQLQQQVAVLQAQNQQILRQLATQKNQWTPTTTPGVVALGSPDGTTTIAQTLTPGQVIGQGGGAPTSTPAPTTPAAAAPAAVAASPLPAYAYGYPAAPSISYLPASYSGLRGLERSTTF